MPNKCSAGVCVCGWRGEWGKWHAKLSVHLGKHLFMLKKIVNRKERVDRSWARSRWSVKKKCHSEQHTVSWAQYQTDWAFFVSNVLKKNKIKLYHRNTNVPLFHLEKRQICRFFWSAGRQVDSCHEALNVSSVIFQRIISVKWQSFLQKDKKREPVFWNLAWVAPTEMHCEYQLNVKRLRGSLEFQLHAIQLETFLHCRALLLLLNPVQGDSACTVGVKVLVYWTSVSLFLFLSAAVKPSIVRAVRRRIQVHRAAVKSTS